MNEAFDLSNESLSQSLAETIAWCGSQQIRITEDTDDIKRRRSLGEQAGVLMHRAFVQRNRLWNRILRRNYTDSPLRRRGLELYRQADLRSIPDPLGEQLRSAALRPTTSIAEIRTNDERAELLREVIQRRSALIRLPGQFTDLGSGKVLLYCPDENLADGAARYSSRGFFDDENV